MDTSSDHIVMLGDSLQYVQDGPRAIGVSGYHLDSIRGGRVSSLIYFAELEVEE